MSGLDARKVLAAMQLVEEDLAVERFAARGVDTDRAVVAGHTLLDRTARSAVETERVMAAVTRLGDVHRIPRRGRRGAVSAEVLVDVVGIVVLADDVAESAARIDAECQRLRGIQVGRHLRAERVLVVADLEIGVLAVLVTRRT